MDSEREWAQPMMQGGPFALRRRLYWRHGVLWDSALGTPFHLMVLALPVESRNVPPPIPAIRGPKLLACLRGRT